MSRENLSEDICQRAREILRDKPTISGLEETHFRIMEETQHPFWEAAVEEAKSERRSAGN